jgi:hypothetical protein
MCNNHCEVISPAVIIFKNKKKNRPQWVGCCFHKTGNEGNSITNNDDSEMKYILMLRICFIS